MSSLRRHSRPVDDRRPWLLLFFRQISLSLYGDFLFGVVVLVNAALRHLYVVCKLVLEVEIQNNIGIRYYVNKLSAYLLLLCPEKIISYSSVRIKMQ